MALTFKELRDYLSRIDRLSICTQEDLCYENYRFLSQVPEKYDTLYVYGIGMIESEFEIDEFTLPMEIEGKRIDEHHFYAKCIEVMLSVKPKTIEE